MATFRRRVGRRGGLRVARRARVRGMELALILRMVGLVGGRIGEFTLPIRR